MRCQHASSLGKQWNPAFTCQIALVLGVVPVTIGLFVTEWLGVDGVAIGRAYSAWPGPAKNPGSRYFCGPEELWELL
jgi:hypothetical protein